MPENISRRSRIMLNLTRSWPDWFSRRETFIKYGCIIIILLCNFYLCWEQSPLAQTAHGAADTMTAKKVVHTQLNVDASYKVSGISLEITNIYWTNLYSIILRNLSLQELDNIHVWPKQNNCVSQYLVHSGTSLSGLCHVVERSSL